MTKQKPEIEEFDKLSITDLMCKTSKELLIAIYVKIKLQNGKLYIHDNRLKWHDRLIFGILAVILATLTTVIINAMRVG
jgi:hypothetical protein